MADETQALCGFLSVLKPPGMTSAHVVSIARRLFDGAKVGHAGTLDPEAAGVLPLMVGKAARLFDYMQDKEKAYVAEVAFGAATDTQDAQGKVIATGEDYPDEAAIRAALPALTGDIMQTPPMFSALKQDGKRLYDLARNGQTADIPPRPVTVHSLDFRGMTPNHGALLALRCSKGFYVRTLCHDLGKLLGCPAHMRFLLRTGSGAFTLRDSHTLESLMEAKKQGTMAQLLLPPQAALGHLPMTPLPHGLEKPLQNGVPMAYTRFASALRGTAAEVGAPFGVLLGGTLTAIAARQGETVKVRTWLGE